MIPRKKHFTVYLDIDDIDRLRQLSQIQGRGQHCSLAQALLKEAIDQLWTDQHQSQNRPGEITRAV